MHALSRLFVVFALVTVFVSNRTFAQTSTTDWSIAALDKILAGVEPGQKTAMVGDMEILVTNLRAWRNQLAGTPGPRSAFDGVVPTWTDGNVYYQFSNNVSVANQKRYVDGITEWAMFANIHFIPRTTQTNYITVLEDQTIGEGGESAVGMIGGEQFLRISPDAWNRPTICHETGHALGLVHEHQRSDRDSYVVVLTNNLANGPDDPNFIKLTNSINKGPYDFLSIMHYNRNALSKDSSLDTLEPLAPYVQYIDIMGRKFDPVLSAADRAGMAATYGPGPTLSADVTNTQDSGVGSLRAAMYYAIDHPGTTITFNIPSSDPHYTNGVLTIQPTDAFPSLLNNTTINGATQSGNPSGPSIQINGALAQPPGVFPNGLHLAGTNSTINDLVVNGFAATGILIDGSNAVANTVAGCYLGIDPTGSFPMTNGFCPLTIQNGARSNIIGGITAAARNIISGSPFQGMTIRDFGTDYNVVEGNYLGLNSGGTGSLPNTWEGLQIFGGARSNIIGGANFNAHNVFSGNTLQGIAITDTNSDGNIIMGNYIGLSPSGTFAIPNGWAGIDIFGGVRNTVIQGNFVSGNSLQGIAISYPGTTGNMVQGNYLGLDAFGQNPIPNGWAGIAIFNGAQSNLVGGLSPTLRNVISGNLNQGIAVSDPGTSGNVIQGNFIGTNPNGTSAISNAWAGIEFFSGPSGNLIGGTTAAARNIVSGNGIQGINLNTCSNNVVQGNYVGVDVTGTIRIPNAASGILLYNNAQSNAIGGSVPGAGNLVSGNANQGIAIFDPGTTSNLVAGNFVGVAADGTTAISNNWSGVEFGNGAQFNFVGGGAGARNTISGNGNYGVLIASANTSFNVVQGNSIGVNSTSMSAVPNSFSGVSIFQGAQSNLIGGTIAGNANIIANNLNDGVQLFDSDTIGNTVRGNSIFSNSGAGLVLYNNANNIAPAPVLASAIVSTNTTIRGSLSGSASTIYHLDFYASPATSPQAMVYLGARDATTANTGSVTFTNTFAALIPAGRVITATATDPQGNTSSLSAAVTVQGTSAVNDGIPDAWRAQYFGGNGTTTNSQSCATCDPDHDGMNNFQEFIAGTNPTNGSSALILTESNTNQLVGVTTFDSSSGVVYSLQYRNDFNIPGWSVLSDQIIGSGTNIVVTDPAPATTPKRFYRVQVLY